MSEKERDTFLSMIHGATVEGYITQTTIKEKTSGKKFRYTAYLESRDVGIVKLIFNPAFIKRRKIDILGLVEGDYIKLTGDAYQYGGLDWQLIIRKINIGAFHPENLE